MTENNLAVIERFYGAFAGGDGETMAACYSPDVRFCDPVFRDLRGERAGAMWKMLTGRSGDLRVELVDHEATGSEGSAHWRAHYTFGPTGRAVVNDVRASFHFTGGTISEHTDEFSFYEWSRQALGPAGTLFGWTPLLRAAVRRQAASQLNTYMANQS